MLTLEQLETFEQDGVLIVPGVVDAQCIARVRRAYEHRLDDIVARACRLGTMSPPNKNAGFDEKMSTLLRVAPQYYQHLDITLPLMSDLAAEAVQWRQLFGDEWENKAGVFADDSVFDLISHPNIVSIAQQLLVDDISASPVQHARIKPPQRLLSGNAAIDSNVSRTLWHQDEAVVTEAAAGVPILTVWLAVGDAHITNGCMFAVRGSHKKPLSAADFGLLTHCPGKKHAAEIYIPDEAIDQDNLIPLEAKAGDAVLLHKRTVHGAGANESDSIRWSFDLRYQPSGTPSGRDCFPLFPLTGKDRVVSGGEYRRKWWRARDDIIDGKVAAVFNDRWNKYKRADLCA